MKRGEQCIPCLVQRAMRGGSIIVRRVAPGFAGGAWGTVSHGRLAAIPQSVLNADPTAYEIVDGDALLREAVARDALRDLEALDHTPAQDASMEGTEDE